MPEKLRREGGTGNGESGAIQFAVHGYSQRRRAYPVTSRPPAMWSDVARALAAASLTQTMPPPYS